MTTKNIGSEGFVWFIGTVEDRDDPLKHGRVRVRVVGLHGNKAEAPTSTLPWASILMPGFSSSLNQVGVSPVGMQIGTTVIGFFMDGFESTIPVIFGSLPGKDDIAKLATGQNTINKQALTYEPNTAFAAKYPFNKVFRSESGHVFEIDDTPNQERTHMFHRSGTYTEVNYEGRQVNKVVGDSHEVVAKNKKIYIRGDLDIEVTGNIRINGKSIVLNKGTKGAARIGDEVPDTETDGTKGIGQGSGTVLIGD